ncbi:MAG: hypothetical protein M0C28_36665 [Candidatus Moduliflexus flocculans]|nr:hypothetical protein [Candidatus Moduliflexus flocculans]
MWGKSPVETGRDTTLEIEIPNAVEVPGGRLTTPCACSMEQAGGGNHLLPQRVRVPRDGRAEQTGHRSARGKV